MTTMTAMNSVKPSGLYSPLCTPMLYGQVDKQSLQNLITILDTHVDGYVPCLSSGEGDKLTDEQRESVVKTTLFSTKKPVFPGIKRKTRQEILTLLTLAQELGVSGITIPVQGESNSEILSYVQDISSTTSLPIIWYNTEGSYISDISVLQKIDSIANCIAIKDSSMNKEFFKQMVQAKQAGELNMSILQGMEHQLVDSQGCDGYLISLANLEPELCKQCFLYNREEDFDKVRELFWKYNLGEQWFVTLKALLFAKGVFASAEQVNPYVTP